jgi:predicted metal-dependent peptidase
MWTDDMPTAAISHRQLFWSPKFFESLDQESRVTILAHELWHNALAHGLRLGSRCPQLWNIAADHVINLLLKEHGYYMGGFPYIMDDKYIGWSTEEVYDDIVKSGGKPFKQDPDGDVIYADGDEDIAEGMGKVVAAFASSKITCKPGDVPGEVELVVDAYLNPKLPWNVILQNYFNSVVEEVYSYARPNRRYSDPIMPGMVGREGLEHLMFAADVSGSITEDQILRFFSEGKHIQEDLEPEAMTLVTFDTKVQNVFRMERGEDFKKFVITGRGGTCLIDLFEMAHKEDATALVIFTDLYVDIPPNPGFPVIWIVVDNPTAEVPYGQLITFNERTGATVK